MPRLARLSISLRRLVRRAQGYRLRTRSERADARGLSSLQDISFLGDDFLDILQDRGAIHDIRRRVSENPLLADHTLRVDEKERPDRGHLFLIEHPETADDLPLRKIAEQRVGQLQRVGEGLLRERVVGTDGEDLNTQGFEPLVVGLPGRQVRGSGRNKSPSVELEEDPLLASEVVQGNV
jgi:hypothetical protein